MIFWKTGVMTVSRNTQSAPTATVARWPARIYAVGRHVFFQIDASAVRERLEGILAITKLLESAIGAELCKGAKTGSGAKV